ncbi:Arginyl-tRNA--protein transferase 1 [Linum perenne]
MAGKMRRSEASSSSGSSSSSSSRGETVVVDCGRCKSSCGYCKSSASTSISHGLWARSITVDDYQDLLDQGWRRSGCFLYKPEMERTCCPSYTIRLRVNDFVPSKEQQRVFRRMQRFLDGTLDGNKSVGAIDDPTTSNKKCTCSCHELSSSGMKDSVSGKNEENKRSEEAAGYLSEQLDNVVRKCTEDWELPSGIILPKASVKKVSQGKRNLLVESGQDLLYSSNIAFQIASTIKRVRSTDKEQQKLNLEDTAITAQLIAEKLVASVAQLTQRNSLTVRACNGHLNFYGAASQLSSSESNASGSEESVRGCKRKGCCLRKNIEHLQGKKRKLEVRLKRSSFDPEEFALYRRYQIQVHNDAPDHVTESSYKRFLVDSPLVFVPPSGDSRVPPCGFGSFHQQYVVDGHLIAVGVVDILPRCLSSKYLFWDPDYAFLSLGKYSASQEIDWVKVNQVHCPSLQHYYLGYYIHSCNKMRYKAAYRPSELLCPLRYQWVPFDVAKPWLDRKAYVVLSDISLTENGESLPPHAPEKVTEDQHDDNVNEDMNDSLVDENEEMVEPESDSSDDETDPEISGYGEAVELEDGNIDDTLIGLKGTRLRYQDLKAAFGAKERKYLESQLHRYRKVVGSELSKKIVYSLG